MGPSADEARARAYVFEEALSIVSAELTRVAHNAAEELKHERLERARKGKSAGPQSAEVQSALVEDSGRTRTHRKTSGGIKRDASSRSLGARRQAKRDRR